MNRKLPLLACLLLAFVVPATIGQSATPRDQAAVVAAYLFNFARFVEWPDAAFKSDQDLVRICAYGTDDLGSRLDALSEKHVHERAIETRRLRRGEAISGCHVLYVSGSEAFYVIRVLEQNATEPILTVSSIAGFASKGGVIGLVTVDNKLRFEINEHAASLSDLKISSQLLKLAKRVFNGGGS